LRFSLLISKECLWVADALVKQRRPKDTSDYGPGDRYYFAGGLIRKYVIFMMD